MRIRPARLAQVGLATAAVLALAVGPQTATAQTGGSSVVVRGMAFPVGTGVAHVGCGNPFGGAGSMTPYVAQGPGRAPAGQRSLGFDLAGGSAAGPVAYTGSLASGGSASVAVSAAQGTTGVAWIGLRDAQGVVWFGRAPISVGGGGWSRVSTAGLSLEWAQYDVGSGERVGEGPSGTLASMLAEHGDGPGLVALTLGCDGAPFFLDAWQVGGRSYDFEGLQTAMSIRGHDQTLVAGQTTTVRGDLGLVGDARVPHATAVLERRTDSGWQTARVIDADAAGAVSAIVEPSRRTAYRWRFADRPLAAGSTSSTYVVDVAFAVSAQVGARSVSGRVSPGDPGVSVSLRRVGSDEVVATDTTTGDGAYAFPTSGLSQGRYVVRAAGTAANQRGESAVVEVSGRAGEPTESAGAGGFEGGTPRPEHGAPRPDDDRRPDQAPTAPPQPAADPTPSASPPADEPSERPDDPEPTASRGPSSSPEPSPSREPATSSATPSGSATAASS